MDDDDILSLWSSDVGTGLRKVTSPQQGNGNSKPTWLQSSGPECGRIYRFCPIFSLLLLSFVLLCLT
jgi:hypothetical protein